MPTPYQKILFATDLGPQSLYIGHRAKDLSVSYNAQLYICHIVEPPITYTIDFAEREKTVHKVLTTAKKSLHGLANSLHVPDKNLIIEIGTPQDNILSIAKQINADLIVVGNQGIGGYTHNLGSSAHHILNQAKCDVLITEVSHLKGPTELQPDHEFLWQSYKIKSKVKTSTGEDKGHSYSGSKHGFDDPVNRGPRLTNRPSLSPYKGGTRKDKNKPDKSDDEQDNKTD